MRQTERHSSADPTITDVAEAAGVSIRTVSRVLNHSPKVNAGTREKIEAAIVRLNFRPSARARALAMGRSFLIGMVHNDRNALVLEAVQRGIVGEAAPEGYELIMHSTPPVNNRAIEDVMDFVRRSRVDGVLVLPPVSGIPGLAAALAEEGVPAVALSATPVEGYASVIISEERRAAAEVARYLVGLGHERIAMVTGPQDMVSAVERRLGFLEALEEAGVPLLVEAEGDYGFTSALAPAEAFLALPEPPTAIFAANDIMAAAVLKVAAARSVGVPSGLSVVGFDGSILAQMLTPALTTVRRPFDEMARQATRQLLDWLGGLPITQVARAELVLIAGESSAPPPHQT
ncbi:LacI family DNA-binding transcriptional regulator [Sphingomonas sp. NFR15]|uniref:LacI family DNA-binding transcriptional regulator n=1 Tax=Sphingomonas sp. NFR15 TaxID=1566282 RepID=UPI00087E994A|nr:LacI family DNA-binding transcriptional regulator [Sphingomonas sp. NFR15]SDA35350.1 transcriptional regulator, LacI family [Sphingomonas sp. NFR15]